MSGNLVPAFAQLVDKRRKAFEGGNGKALFDAIALCALTGQRLPPWAARAFRAGYEKVDSYEVGSWDEAFGKPYTKGTKLGAKRKEHLLRVDVYEAITEAMAGGVKTPHVFRVVGAKFEIGSSKARDYYYGIRDAMVPADRQ